MEEISLLREALKQLDQPFLVVIVGEFNSGKSTVINALLGTRFLAEGILPTTNEISVLKFRHVSILSYPSVSRMARSVSSAFCVFTCHLCVELLPVWPPCYWIHAVLEQSCGMRRIEERYSGFWKPAGVLLLFLGVDSVSC